jgi:hydrogenase nickel incorporation protein HypA/HybF
MHELAICQALISQVDDIARQQAGRVRSVRIGVGPLAGVEPRLLADAYPIAGAGTAAEGSHLMIEQTQLRVKCRLCGTESTPPPNRLLCDACGDWRTDLLAGDELLLLSVEFEIPETPVEVCHV